MPIRLFRADLAWWQFFVSRWNGILSLPTRQQLPVHQLTLDASGHWGCGAWSGESWFQVRTMGCQHHRSAHHSEGAPTDFTGGCPLRPVVE
jgi:hypothetical protein